jgi:hypothetical protein
MLAEVWGHRGETLEEELSEKQEVLVRVFSFDELLEDVDHTGWVGAVGFLVECLHFEDLQELVVVLFSQEVDGAEYFVLHLFALRLRYICEREVKLFIVDSH